MRGLIDDLESPHRLGERLPALYQTDDFAQRLMSAFDAVLAPLLSSLDNRSAYFDPSLAPEDFVEWLAGWLGLRLDENWSVDRRRTLVAEAGDLFRWRGTRRGLAGYVAVYTGEPPDINDSGGVAWSTTPGAALPGTGASGVTVRVRRQADQTIDSRQVEAVVREAIPAHVAFRVEVVDP